MKTHLKNGLRLVTEEVKGVRSVSLGIAFLSGSRHETESQSGISHLIEHMLFKGTPKRDAYRIAVETDSLGAELNGFTTKEFTYYYSRFLDQHLERVWDILSDIILNSTFSLKELKREKGVVIEEIKNSKDSPEEEVFQNLYNCLYSSHPISYPILGKEETVNSLDRKKLLEYKKKHYSGGNTIVSASGRFSLERLKDLVDSTLRELPSISEETPSRPFPKDIIRLQEKSKKDISQVHIVIGRRTFKYDSPQRYSSLVLNTLLGGSMSSRLFQRLREQEGMVYNIFSFLQFYSDTGIIGVYLATGTSNRKKAIDLVFKELNRLTKYGLNKDELRNTKEQLKGGFTLGLESTVNRMVRILKEEIYLQREVTVDETLKSIDKVSEEEVMSLAGELFDRDQFAVSIVSPE